MDIYDFGQNVILPAFAIFMVFGAPLMVFVFFRVLKHRERMAMFQSGVNPGGFPTPPTAPRAQQSGQRRVSCDDLDAQTALKKGIRLAFIGFAITLGLSFIGVHDGSFRPGPWLLGGLIPMFIGVSQILIAMISGATLGPHATGPSNTAYGSPYQMPPPPPSQPSSPSDAPPTYDSSYTYRPGSTEQLNPPPTPPDRR